jgi:hypothetical protein
VHEMNSEIVKSGMVVLTVREKTDVVVQPAAGIVVHKRKRQS